jgi:L-rhamnose-H+ transport protein
MERPLVAGVALTLLAGVMSGNCMLPLKFVRSWAWENVWLVFSVTSLIVLPWALALSLVDHLLNLYATLPFSVLVLPFAMGMGWGVAQILFGISVQRLGLALAYAVIVGLGAVLGTLVPFFVLSNTGRDHHTLELVLAGVALTIVGIFLITWGGRIHDLDTRSHPEPGKQQAYAAAIGLAVLCGVLAPMLNYSFAFGKPIADRAIAAGNTAAHSGYAIWPVGLAGGFLPNAAYSLYLLWKNRTLSLFRLPGKDSSWPLLMGFLWMGAFALYSLASSFLGPLGTSIGWGLMQIFMIAAATASGIFSGEWKSASRSAFFFLSSGLTALAFAIALLAKGSR